MSRYGSKRLGLLTPAGNTTMEDDFARWMPDSVKLHVNRLFAGSENSSSTPQGLLAGLQELGDNVEGPAQWLATASVDVIAFGCTGASFLNGLGYDRVITGKIEDAAGGIKAVAAAGAVVDALNELGASRIAVCTPYPEELNQRLRSFYTDAGFDIVSFDHVENISHSFHNEDAAREEVLELAISVDRPEAEAIFISCTAFEGAGEVIERVEETTGKPVVTSNQATFWSCMSELGVNEPIPGAGRLLAERVAA
jgi:arylmalonate decarboxylase